MPAHGPAGDCEKVLPVLPVHFLCPARKANVDLIDQLGRLQRVALALTLHQVMREPAQVSVDQPEKFVFSLRASFPPLLQELGNLSELTLRHNLPSRFSSILPQGGGLLPGVPLSRVRLRKRPRKE